MRKPLHSGHYSLRRGRISTPGRLYLVTTTTYQRNPIFTDFRKACAASACFESQPILQSSMMVAWVLMPDHVHWVVNLGIGDVLSRLVQRLKCASSRAVGLIDGVEQVPVWAKAFHDRALRQEDSLQDVVRYVMANPLRAGLVNEIGDYPFWDVVSYGRVL